MTTNDLPVDPPAEVIQVTWVYCGQRLTHSGEQRHEWRDAADPSDDNAHQYGPKNIVSGASIGGLYELNVTTEMSVKLGGAHPAPRFVGRFTDLDLIAAWKALDSQYRVMKDGTSAAKKLKKDHGDLGDLTLNQITLEYRKCRTGPRQHAFLAAIIGHLTSTRVIDAGMDED